LARLPLEDREEVVADAAVDADVHELAPEVAEHGLAGPLPHGERAREPALLTIRHEVDDRVDPEAALPDPVVAAAHRERRERGREVVLAALELQETLHRFELGLVVERVSAHEP